MSAPDSVSINSNSSENDEGKIKKLKLIIVRERKANAELKNQINGLVDGSEMIKLENQKLNARLQELELQQTTSIDLQQRIKDYNTLCETKDEQIRLLTTQLESVQLDKTDAPAIENSIAKMTVESSSCSIAPDQNDNQLAGPSFNQTIRHLTDLLNDLDSNNLDPSIYSELDQLLRHSTIESVLAKLNGNTSSDIASQTSASNLSEQLSIANSYLTIFSRLVNCLTKLKETTIPTIELDLYSPMSQDRFKLQLPVLIEIETFVDQFISSSFNDNIDAAAHSVELTDNSSQTDFDSQPSLDNDDVTSISTNSDDRDQLKAQLEQAEQKLRHFKRLMANRIRREQQQVETCVDQDKLRAELIETCQRVQDLESEKSQLIGQLHSTNQLINQVKLEHNQALARLDKANADYQAYKIKAVAGLRKAQQQQLDQQQKQEESNLNQQQMLANSGGSNGSSKVNVRNEEKEEEEQSMLLKASQLREEAAKADALLARSQYDRVRTELQTERAKVEQLSRDQQADDQCSSLKSQLVNMTQQRDHLLTNNQQELDKVKAEWSVQLHQLTCQHKLEISNLERELSTRVADLQLLNEQKSIELASLRQLTQGQQDLSRLPPSSNHSRSGSLGVVVTSKRGGEPRLQGDGSESLPSPSPSTASLSSSSNCNDELIDPHSAASTPTDVVHKPFINGASPRLSSTSNRLIPLDELLGHQRGEHRQKHSVVTRGNSTDSTNQLVVELTGQVRRLKQILSGQQTRIEQLTDALTDSDANMGRLTELNRALKNEIRRLDNTKIASVSRQDVPSSEGVDRSSTCSDNQHLIDAVYLKNLLIKLGDLPPNSSQCEHLVNVLSTLLGACQPEERLALSKLRSS